MDPVYILLRTSGRPEFFRQCMESIKSLTYPNIVTIVHTDDPRDTYVEGDYIIKGEVLPKSHGAAPYNSYNNRLLKAIPSPGWVHFMDDDDVYVDKDVFEKLIAGGDKDRMHIGRVERWPDKSDPEKRVVFPRGWKKQRSFQTECFIVWSTLAKKCKWWSEKGGDHYYTRQLSKIAGHQWIDNVLIARAIEKKGHGRRLDAGGVKGATEKNLKPSTVVNAKIISRGGAYQVGKVIEIPYKEALILEQHGYARITYKGITLYRDGRQVRSL